MYLGFFTLGPCEKIIIKWKIAGFMFKSYIQWTVVE